MSLIELVVVITVTGILAGVVGAFLAEPLRAMVDQSRRAALVDAAVLAQLRLARDLRRALPNSVRVAGNALELLLTEDGARYRAEPPGGSDDRLRFNGADDRFNTLTLLAGGIAPAGARLAVYPTGQAGADPYADAVMTPAGTSVTLSAAPVTVSGSAEYRVALDPAHGFPFDSPNRRVFLVRGPVSYFCDTADGRLVRHADYAVQPTQPATAAALEALAPGAIVTTAVESCSFAYAAGTAERNAVVTVALALAAAEERIRLVRQVHVDNVP